MSSDLAELLYSAYASDFGIVVETNDAEFLRQKLYPIRKENPDLSVLSFIISPFNNSDLWIVKNRTPDE